MEPESVSHVFLRERIAYVDRRSLSQAWYSAMHTVQANGAAASQRRGAAAQSRGPIARANVRGEVAVDAAVRSRSVMTRSSRNLKPAAAPDARTRLAGQRARLAIPAKVTARRPNSKGTAFTLTFRDARVHVRVCRAPAGVNVVALCAGLHVEAVSRALAGVVHLLRRDGENVIARVVPLGDPR